MPPKRSVLKPYLHGVSPLKRPTSSLGTALACPNSCCHLQPSESTLNSRHCLLGRVKRSPRLQGDGWGRAGTGPIVPALCQQHRAGPWAPEETQGYLDPEASVGVTISSRLLSRGCSLHDAHRAAPHVRGRSFRAPHRVKRRCFRMGKGGWEGPHLRAPSTGQGLLRMSQSVLSSGERLCHDLCAADGELKPLAQIHTEQLGSWWGGLRSLVGLQRESSMCPATCCPEAPPVRGVQG